MRSTDVSFAAQLAFDRTETSLPFADVASQNLLQPLDLNVSLELLFVCRARQSGELPALESKTILDSRYRFCWYRRGIAKPEVSVVVLEQRWAVTGVSCSAARQLTRW